MKVNGSIFVESMGASLLAQANSNVDHVAEAFIEMRQEADRCCDKLYFVDDEGWSKFYLWLYTPFDDLQSNKSQRIHQMLSTYSGSHLIGIQNVENFDEKPLPRSKGGFWHEDVIGDEFLYNKETIDSWHRKWFLENPDKIDWSESHNAVFPCLEAIITILCAELHKKNIKIIPNSNDITNAFYDLIVKGMSPTERISYSEIVGSMICRANYYRRERELEKLEEHKGNKKAKVVFSIIRKGKYQFLSIDTQHCMFELCDEKGDHMGELRFDGSPNGGNTIDPSHSLLCVDKWKQRYRK